jgi:hypothetical protein
VGWFDVVGAGVSPKNDGPSLVVGVGIVDGKADNVLVGATDGVLLGAPVGALFGLRDKVGLSVSFVCDGDVVGACIGIRPVEGDALGDWEVVGDSLGGDTKGSSVTVPLASMLTINP